MALATEKVADTFLDIVVNVGINCNWPLYADDEVEVVYGLESLTATLNVDFEVTLDGPNYDTFIVTPRAPLLTKINDLISGNPEEFNYITIRRKLDFTTSVQPEIVRNVVFLSREIERIHMKLIQLKEGLLRSVTSPVRVVGEDATQIIFEAVTPNAVLILDALGQKIISGPETTDIAAVADHLAEIDAVNAALTEILTVYNDSAEINALAAITTAISSLALITTEIVTVYNDSAEINALAAITANINALAAIIPQLLTVYGDSAEINALAAITVAINTLNTNIAAIATCATNITSIINAANNIPKANLTATTAPTVTDDTAAGYRIGSLWTKTTATTGVWICLDATNGAAVWAQVNIYDPTAIDASGSFKLSANINPGALGAGTQNDYNPSFLATRSVLRQSASADGALIGGLQQGTNGKILIIENIGSTYNLTLLHEEPGSTAANRIVCPGNSFFVIPPNSSVALRYDGTSSRWRVQAPMGDVQASNVASAATVNFNAAVGNFLHVTGTTTITAITLNKGAEKTVVFDGVLTLTHGASLLLPGAANIITAAGDVAMFRGEASGVVRCVSYTKANGQPLYSRQVFLGGPNPGAALGTAGGNYWPISGNGASPGALATNNYGGRMAAPGIIKKFKFWLYTVPGGSGTRTFTIRKNDVATALTVTFGSAESGLKEIATDVAFAEGDTIEVVDTKTGTVANSQAQWSLDVLIRGIGA